MLEIASTDASDVLIAWGPVLAPLFAAAAAIISAVYAKGAHRLAKHTDREVNNKKPGEPTLREIVICLKDNQEKMIATADRHENLLCNIQHSLSQNDARVRHILASLATFETDASGEYTWVSRRWSEMTGVPLFDASGRTWEGTIDLADKQRVVDEWARAVSLKESFGPTIYRLKNKNPIEAEWVIAEASPVRNYSGEVVGYIGSVEYFVENSVAIDFLEGP
jgi:PAS domain-containing protein